MMVLVDTSIWSLALRRSGGALNREQLQARNLLTELVKEGRAQIIGPIRQELLSGIREERQFQLVRQRLRAFDEVSLSREDYEEAAQVSNHCRTHGVMGSTIDCLICATAIRREWAVLTGDRDFQRYAKVIPLSLYQPS